MKKIIYSLVIMIAAGSLFTSCIEQVEPVGLLDMRTAKAEYIRALKDLRAADAEYVRAKAAVKQADARYVDAQTAYQNAVTANQQLLNKLQELYNEAQEMENELRAAEIAAEIAELEMQVEKDLAAHAVAMVKSQAELAKAQEALRVVLRDIAIASKSLSPNEKLAVAEAAALVAVLTEAQYQVIVELAQAEAELDSTILNALKNDFTWDEGLLEGTQEHYQHQIEKAQENIAQYKAFREAIPDTLATLEEWKAVLDAYDKAIEVIDEEMAKNTYDSTAYFKVIVGSGIQAFNEAIAAFIEENWVEKNGTYTEPADEAAPVDPSKMTDAQKKEAGYFVGASDSIRLSKLERKPKTGKTISPISWAKYQYLLKDYDVDSPWSKIADSDEGDAENIKNILYFDADTAKWGAVKNDGKDWILGDYNQGAEPVKYKGVSAKYGLKGAYSILERDYVTSNYQETTEAEKEAKQREVDSLANLWTKDRDTLMKGLAEYDLYKAAKATKREKDSLLNVALAKKVQDSAAVVSAAKALFVKINELESGAQPAGPVTVWSVDDSTQLITLISNYAAQVENYLENPDTAHYAAGKNPLFFYFCHSTSTDVTNIQDSVKFSALASGEKQAYWKFTTTYGITPAVDNMGNTPEVRKQAFVNILNQLFDVTLPNAESHICLASIITKLTAGSYLEGYDLVQGNPNKWYIDNWSAAKPKLMSGVEDNEFEPEYVEEARKAVAIAAQGVVTAEAKYWQKYDRFWNDPIEAEVRTQENAKYDVNYEVGGKKQGDKYYKLYSLNTFKDYSKDEVVVCFGTTNNELDIVLTTGLKAILTAVDPMCAQKSNNDYFTDSNINTSALLGATTTDLYKWALAKYQYMMMDTNVSADLAAIKEWIETVERQFREDKDNETKTNSKYATDVANYPTKYAEWEKKHAAYETYIAKKKAFVGTHTEVIGGKDSAVLNDLYLKKVDDEVVTVVSKPVKDEDFAIRHVTNNITDLFATNILGDYVGWTKYLGGEQLANAKKAFGEKPYEQIQEWKDEWKAGSHIKTGITDAKTKAEAVYVAKAKVEGIDGGKETIADMIAAREVYITDLTNKIAAEQTKINTAMENIESFLKDDFNWDKLIAQQTAKVEALKSQLNAISKALESANANLDKIMDYIRSTDAEFVIPVTLEDVDLVIETIEKALAVIGLFPDPEDPAVEPEEMTLADAIAALLAQYGVSVNIDFQPAQD